MAGSERGQEVETRVLTDRGVEMQPTGCRPHADLFARAVRDHRQHTTIVSETCRVCDGDGLQDTDDYE